MPLRTRYETLVRQVLATVTRHRMVRAGDAVGLAVSGGADSVALMRLFLEVREQLDISLVVVHLNHKLRGQESDADETFVAKLAKQFGMKFFAVREDCATEARRNRWNLEDAGRRARYRYFKSLVASQRYTSVATAHTADDQAETVLARLIRGSSFRGLAGIHPVNDVIIRPLITSRRADLRDYLRVIGQDWREDSTNFDQTRLRARLRHSLIPLLERQYNPQVVNVLSGLATQAHSEEALWHLLIEQSLRAARCKDGVWSITLKELLSPAALSEIAMRFTGDRGYESAAADAVTRRIVLALLNRLSAAPDSAPADEPIRAGTRPGGRFDSKHIEQVMRLARTSQSGRELELLNGVRVARVFDRLEFSCAHRKISPKRFDGTTSHSPPSYTYEYGIALHAKSSVTINVPELRSRFRLKLIDWPERESETSECEVLDADRLRHPLVLRNWRSGDVYHPPGLRHAQKFKHYFAKHRIGLLLRPGWPVLASGSEVAWSRGCVAANFQVTDGSKQGLLISEGEDGPNPP